MKRVQIGRQRAEWFARAILTMMMLFRCELVCAAEPPAAELLVPNENDVPSRLILHGSAQVSNPKEQLGLRLPNEAYAEWNPAAPPATDAGAFSLWVSPLWAAEDQQSHTFATFSWSGPDQSYFALSQGWWEPQGARKLHVVLSNQQQVSCLMPWKFDYTLYLANQWTMLGVSWQAGNPGFLRLYVDGKLICERKSVFSGGRKAVGPIYLGSDLGAGVEHRGRSSDVAIKNIQTTPRASSAEEMRRTFMRGGGINRPKWILALADHDPPVDIARERRVMFDEDTGWASSRAEIERRVKRIKSAGFNVYAPCVWDGAHAFFLTTIGPVAASIRDPANPRYDPLAYLIALAHREGLTVHPWFIVARHPPGSVFPASYLLGAPEGAFNVHSVDFRDFIVSVVVDAATRYDLDGLNLDYVRAMGPCSNPECIGEYTKKYGRSLAEDWKYQEQGGTVASLIEWNRAAITDIVSRISRGARKVKPHVVLTVDTVPFDHSRQHQGLDEEHWLHARMVDAVVDMAYDDPVDVDTLDRAVEAFTAARHVVTVRDYDVFGDTVVDRSGDVMADYIRLIRSRWPGAGVGFYQYPHLSADQIQLLSRDVFGKAAIPARTH